MMKFLQEIDSVVLLASAPLVWFGLQALLSLIIRPYRRKLRDGLDVMRKTQNLSQTETYFVDHLWRTAISVRSAILISLAYASGLTMSKEAILRERVDAERLHPSFWVDSRVDDLTDWYFLSIFAANPLFGLLALVLRIFWRFKLIYIYRRIRIGDSRRLADLPTFEAALKA